MHRIKNNSIGRTSCKVMQEVKVFICGWLGYYCVVEGNLAGLERVVAVQIPNVHLEIMEEVENKGSQFEEAGDIG